MKEQRTNMDKEYAEKREDRRDKKGILPKDNFMIILLSVIFFWSGTEFCKSSWYMIIRDFTVFRTILYGINKLGWILGCLGYNVTDFIRKKWVKNKKLDMTVRIISYVFVLNFSFLLGVGSWENVDLQKKVEEILVKPASGEEISDLLEEAEQIAPDMVIFDSTVEWEMEAYYKLSISGLEEEDLLGKVLYFHRWLYGKLVGVDKLLENIQINYEECRDEKIINVVDRLVSYGDKQLYINNPNIEQGEIRYKLLNEEEWSEWISVDELKDGKMDITQELEMLNWKLGDREDAFVVVNDKAEIIFCSIGEEYILEKNILRELLDEAEIDKEIDFEKCEVRFRVEEDVKGDREYFQDRQRLDLEELKLKSGDKIAIEFYIDNYPEGIYSVEQLGSKKGIERFYLNTIDEKQTDNAVIKMELYMYERK